MYTERMHNIHRIDFANGATTSQIVDLRGGCFGTFIIPTGSSVIGKTIQFTAVESESLRTANKVMPDTDLLTTPKTISAAGPLALTSDEIAEAGVAGFVKFKLNSSVSGAATIYLMWKS